MLQFPINAADIDILNAVDQWVNALADENYEAAYEMTYHPSSDHWTPELMKTAITNYGSIDPFPDGRTYQVTPIETAKGDRVPYRDVIWWKLERFPYRGDIHFDLPLNGEWSDLSAIFHIQQIGNSLVLELHDLHVL